MTQVEEPDNTRLLQAMKMVARLRSAESRNKLYHALVASELWLALSRAWREGEPLATEDLEPSGELQGRPSAALFTSREFAAKWRADHEHFVLLNGTDLFGALIETRIGSVQINPAGSIGGELYRHEVESIAEGGRILRLREAAGSILH